MRYKISIFLFLICLATHFFAQSTIQKEDTGPADTLRSNAYLDIANDYYTNGETDSAIFFAMKGYELARKQYFVRGIYKNINIAGLSLSLQGKNNEAMQLFNVGKAYSVAGKNKKGESKMLLGLGICETRKGNYKQAIDHFLAALKIEETVGKNKEQLANIYNNIAVVFKKSGDFLQSRRYNRVALQMRIELKDSLQIALSYNNLGNTFSYNDPASCDSVFYFVNKALEIRKKINNPMGIAQSWNNLGTYYLNMEIPDSALVYYHKSYNENVKLGLTGEIMNCLNNLAETYYDLKRFEEARKYGDEALKVAIDNEFKDLESSCRKKLAKIYFALGDFKRSAELFKSYVAIRDTFFSQTLEDKIAEARHNFEFEKKEDKLKQEQAIKDAVFAEEKRVQKIIIGSITAGLLLVLLVLVLVFRGYQQKKRANILIAKQKEEVEEQKHIIEEKQKEIIDSIYYARRIQRSLLTKEKYIDRTIRKLSKS